MKVEKAGITDSKGVLQVISDSPKPGEDYTIKKGDTLWRIAEKVYGDGSKYVGIEEANKDVIKDASFIKAGIKIKIPTKEEIEKLLEKLQQKSTRSVEDIVKYKLEYGKRMVESGKAPMIIGPPKLSTSEEKEVIEKLQDLLEKLGVGAKELLKDEKLAELLKIQGALADLTKLINAIENKDWNGVVASLLTLVRKLPDNIKVEFLSAIGGKIPKLGKFFDKELLGELARCGALDKSLKMIEHLIEGKGDEVIKSLLEVFKDIATSPKALLKLADAMKDLIPPELLAKVSTKIGIKGTVGSVPIINIIVAAVSAGIDGVALINLLKRQPPPTGEEVAIAVAKILTSGTAAIPGAGGAISVAGDIIIAFVEFAMALNKPGQIFKS